MTVSFRRSSALLRGDLTLRITHAAIAAAITVGSLAALTSPVQAAEYSSALKVRSIQYDAPRQGLQQLLDG